MEGHAPALHEAPDGHANDPLDDGTFDWPLDGRRNDVDVNVFQASFRPESSRIKQLHPQMGRHRVPHIARHLRDIVAIHSTGYEGADLDALRTADARIGARRSVGMMTESVTCRVQPGRPSPRAITTKKSDALSWEKDSLSQIGPRSPGLGFEVLRRGRDEYDIAHIVPDGLLVNITMLGARQPLLLGRRKRYTQGGKDIVGVHRYSAEHRHLGIVPDLVPRDNHPRARP